MSASGMPDPILDALAGLRPIVPSEAHDDRVRSRCHDALARRRRKVLVRQRVDVAEQLDVVAVVADVGGLEHEAPWQLALEADLPAELLRHLRVLVEEADRVAERRLAALRVADRLQDRGVEERVVPVCRDRRPAGVEGGPDGGRLRVARLDHVAAPLPEEAGEEPDAIFACCGGGSNFAGLVFPFLRKKITEKKKYRIVAVEHDQVTFTYYDNREDQHRERKPKQMTIPAVEFIHRFLMHVLPDRFVRIRHYGLHHGSCRAKLQQARRLLGLPAALPVVLQLKLLDWLKKILQTEQDPRLCQACQKGLLIPVRQVAPMSEMRARFLSWVGTLMPWNMAIA